MVLKAYRPQRTKGGSWVRVSKGGFYFSAQACNLANLNKINWMRLHSDSDERIVVFEPIPGLEKSEDLLRLSTPNRRNVKFLIAKGLIAEEPWIHAVGSIESSESRRFDLKKYEAQVPPPPPDGKRGKNFWYIRLMPAFEHVVLPSKIHQIDFGLKGIYRYWGGKDGQEIVYIGKGFIRKRYQEDPVRRN